MFCVPATTPDNRHAPSSEGAKRAAEALANRQTETVTNCAQEMAQKEPMTIGGGLATTVATASAGVAGNAAGKEPVNAFSTTASSLAAFINQRGGTASGRFMPSESSHSILGRNGGGSSSNSELTEYLRNN